MFASRHAAHTVMAHELHIMGLALLIGGFGFGERWAWKGCHKICPKTFVLHLQEIVLLGCK